MRVSGTATLHGPVERVYAVLHDPAVLVRTIPGCQELEQVAPDTYRMRVHAGVAAVRGTFSGEVRLADGAAPHEFVLHASGSGAPGTVDARVRVSLAGGAGGGTDLAYDAEATVGGMVGGVGQRVLAGVARRTSAEFFAAVDAVLTGQPEAALTAAEPAAAPAVFTRPPVPAGGDFARGVVFGAAAALLGVLLGGALGGRRR